jgi:DNA-binding response OmpR family regulator
MSSQAERLKGCSREESDIYDDGYLRIEHRNYYVACGGEQLRLSRKEFLIVSYLAQNSGRIVPPEEIWSYTWGGDVTFSFNTLKVHIHRVRRQLEPFDVHIKNRPNKGYKLLCGTRAGQGGNGR